MQLVNCPLSTEGLAQFNPSARAQPSLTSLAALEPPLFPFSPPPTYPLQEAQRAAQEAAARKAGAEAEIRRLEETRAAAQQEATQKVEEFQRVKGESEKEGRVSWLST